MNEPTEFKSAADSLASVFADLEKTIAELPPNVRERRRHEGEEFLHRQKQMRIDNLIAESRAPRRQLNNNNIVRSGPWAAAENAIISKLETGCLLALVGTRGCGKTQLAVEAIRFCATHSRRARYCTATEFFVEIKSTYGDDARTEKDVIAEFSRPSLLVIDEIGQRSESEWENRLLFELLNRRYNALKDTILISNQTPADFAASMGPSLISRMQETGGLIECTWPSYRNSNH